MQCFSVLGFKIIAEPESALLSVLLTTVPFILQLSPELFVRIVYREILQKLNIRQCHQKHLYRFHNALF